MTTKKDTCTIATLSVGNIHFTCSEFIRLYKLAFGMGAGWDEDAGFFFWISKTKKTSAPSMNDADVIYYNGRALNHAPTNEGIVEEFLKIYDLLRIEDEFPDGIYIGIYNGFDDSRTFMAILNYIEIEAI